MVSCVARSTRPCLTPNACLKSETPTPSSCTRSHPVRSFLLRSVPASLSFAWPHKGPHTHTHTHTLSPSPPSTTTHLAVAVGTGEPSRRRATPIQALEVQVVGGANARVAAVRHPVRAVLQGDVHVPPGAHAGVWPAAAAAQCAAVGTGLPRGPGRWCRRRCHTPTRTTTGGTRCGRVVATSDDSGGGGAVVPCVHGSGGEPQVRRLCAVPQGIGVQGEDGRTRAVIGRGVRFGGSSRRLVVRCCGGPT